MRTFGIQELLIILVIAVFLFGGKKLPEIAKGLGEGIKNFKNAMKSEDKPEEKQPEQKKA
jgi:sec-independent protein translocase protein TatA